MIIPRANSHPNFKRVLINPFSKCYIISLNVITIYIRLLCSFYYLNYLNKNLNNKNEYLLLN